MLDKLFLRVAMFFKGIRFYKTNLIPKNPEFRRATFQLNTGSKLDFYFYRENFEDMVYQRGTIKKKRFTGYIIQARFSDDLPRPILQYNNLKFFFDHDTWLFQNEESLTDILLNIFMDFIESELKK